MRPGYLGDIFSQVPTSRPSVRKAARSSARRGFSGFGAFGKGFIAPPPPPAGPGSYQDGKWVCPGSKPASDATHFWQCCPTGWTKVPYGDTNPCKDSAGEFQCGPRPPDGGDYVCCPSMARWMPRDPGGADPCLEAREVAPTPILSPEEILSDPIDMSLKDEPPLSPGLVVAIGAAMLAGLGLTLFMTKRD